jgi:hypothetical protein
MMETVTSRDVVVVSRSYEPEGDVLSLARDLAASTVGLVVYSAQTAVALTEATIRATIGSVLDRIVPALADAIVSRMDLTDIVLSNVDLRPIVIKALDEIDLTEIVVDRVDVNRIVEQADIDSVIDRVPMLQIADYIIEEIDLPQIIRESTGGVALDAFTTTRVSAIRTDEILSKVVDAVLLRRRQRDLDAPAEVVEDTANQQGTA